MVRVNVLGGVSCGKTMTDEVERSFIRVHGDLIVDKVKEGRRTVSGAHGANMCIVWMRTGWGQVVVVVGSVFVIVCLMMVVRVVLKMVVRVGVVGVVEILTIRVVVVRKRGLG